MIDAEEFGIDWTERDGFSIQRARSSMLWGPDSDRQLFTKGMRPRFEKLTRAANHLMAGESDAMISREMGMAHKTVARLRQALSACGVKLPPRASAHDLTGRQFGKWVVMQRAGSKRIGRSVNPLWLSRCECGTERAVMARSLTSGVSRSCGCVTRARFVALVSTSWSDLVGQRFGRLVVRSRSKRDGWRCRCDCGGQTTARTWALKSGQHLSCGCLIRYVRRIGAMPPSVAVDRRRERHRGYSRARVASLHPTYVRQCARLSRGAWPELITLFRLIVQQRRELKHGN